MTCLVYKNQKSLIFISNRVEKFILGELSHQPMNKFNRSATAISGRLSKFIFSSLVARIVSSHQESAATQVWLALLQFLRQIENLASSVLGVAQQSGAAESVYPVFVPQWVQEFAIQGRLEVSDIKLVVLFAVDSEIFNLV